MKIAFLWSELSGYMNVCLKELAQREAVELFVCHQATGKAAPFDKDQFNWIPRRMTWATAPDLPSLTQELRSFKPDVLIIPAWHIKEYRRVARMLAKKSLRIMGMDNPWRGTLKQWLGIVSSRYFLHPLAEAAWVPGERQAVFARKLGFPQGAILRGLYSSDSPQLGVVHQTRIARHEAVPRRFIFIGRFVADKGIHVLARAYARYRQSEKDPWPLTCCGVGPLKHLLESQPGIEIEGFVQPARLGAMLSTAGCLVLPSSFENWALVVHEAAAAGLLILASENVGAAVHLVQPEHNGFICTNADVEELAGMMRIVSSMSDARLDRMSRASHALAQQFSPGRWADTVLNTFNAWPGISTPGKRPSKPESTQGT